MNEENNKMAYEVMLDKLKPYKHKCFMWDENNEVKIRNDVIKYIIRIDNGKPLENDTNLNKAFLKFCELNNLNPITSRFGWVQTRPYNLSWRLHNNENLCVFRVYKITDESVFNYHLFYDYTDFIHFLDDGGNPDEEGYSDQDRSDIINNSRGCEEILKRDENIQIIFEEDTVKELFSSNSLDTFLKYLDDIDAIEMISF